MSGTFEDSMRPLQQTGRLRLIKVNGDEVLPGIRFVPAPGHSIDHAVIELNASNRKVIFGGDLMHYPLELFNLDLVSTFCEFPEAARQSRRSKLARCAEVDALYLTAHIPLSSAGKVKRKPDGYDWIFVDRETE